MHPDVRAAERAVCHRCGMTLAPMDARAFAENGLEVDVARGRASGTIALTMRVTEKVSGTFSGPTGEKVPDTFSVRDFEVVHERPFHLFVVSRDLAHFDHVHPELGSDGAFRLELRVPRSGVYRLVADFYPKGGVPQTVQRTIVTPGFAGPLFAEPPALVPDAREKTAGGLRIALDAVPLVAGREATLTFTCLDAAGLGPADLEPFLGAPGHLLVMSADLVDAIHSHPEGTGDLGLGTQPGTPPGTPPANQQTVERVPSPQSLVPVTFSVRFPRPGGYRMWLQVQRRGNVITVPFSVTVREPGVARQNPEHDP